MRFLTTIVLLVLWITPSFTAQSFADGAGHQAVVRIEMPNGQFARTAVVKEGESFRLTGLAYPLEYLNGSELYFPDGALTESITITISLPDPDSAG